MPLNLGANISTSRTSAGQAVVFIGPAGSTPTADVGLIGEDGAEVELQTEFGDIMAGNPAMTIERYAKVQNAFCRFRGVEWSANLFAYALGTGVTAISGTNEILRFGGDPCPDTLAILLQHRKCTAAHTINWRFWKVQPETGGFTMQFGQDHHGFDYSYKAIYAATNWAGSSLANTSNLVEMDIQLS